MRERVEALFAVITAHAAVSYAAEGHVRGGKMDDRVVDAAAAEGAGIQHAPLGLLVRCEQIQRQRLFPAADEIDGLVQPVKFQHGQNRPENFFLHDGAVRRDAVQQRGRDEARFLVEFPASHSCLALQQLCHAGKVLFRHDHGHFVHRAVREEFPQRLFVCLDERSLDRPLDQQIVRLHAGLPGIQDLAERDAPRGELHIGGFVHDDGALAAELERDGREVLCRSLHHDLSDGDAAGEENGVKALRQQRAVFRAPALDGGNIARVKITRDELRDGRARRGGVGRRLYDGAVAAGDRADQRRQAELDGVIPGRDNQRNAIRLR